MNKRFLTTATLIASSVLFMSGCDSDNSSYETPNTSGAETNSGIISQKNFSLLTADVEPAVIDATTDIFTKTDVELTVYIGDRNNQILTDSHTINFETEYGLIEPSCVTTDGWCSVMWSAIKRPDPGGPGSDGFVTITAYTTGEEGFTDTNGNSLFDDGDAGFDDLEEPFIDADNVHGVASNGFTAGDVIINVVNTYDPFGTNQFHDIADGFFNGPGCTHLSLCGLYQSIVVFDGVTMSLVANIPLSRTIGGSVAGLAGTGLILRNTSNGNTEDLTIDADGPYTFTTPVDDGQTYTVTVLTQPTTGPSQTCGVVANASGTVSANVTNVDVACATNTFTIGGAVAGIPATETLTIVNNGGDALAITANGPYVFATPIADGAIYDVDVSIDPATAVCTVTLATKTGTVPGADVTDVAIVCI